MSDEPTPNAPTLTPEERSQALALARMIATDLLRLVKIPLRREVLAKVAWILQGDSPNVQD